MATSDKKLVRSKSGLRMLPVKEDVYNPLTLIEPVWIPDSECQKCPACQLKFDFINRRHHCRRCGQCFCNNCSQSKAHLPRYSFVDPVRQCADCLTKTKKEKDFFESHHKILLNGATFDLSSTSFAIKEDSDKPHVYFCSLAKDSRRIVLDSVSDKHEVHDAIELMDIDSVQLLSSSGDSPSVSPTGILPIVGIQIRYKDSEGVHQTVKFLASQDLSSQRDALAWAQALKMAVKFVFERRDQMRQSSSSPTAEMH